MMGEGGEDDLIKAILKYCMINDVDPDSASAQMIFTTLLVFALGDMSKENVIKAFTEMVEAIYDSADFRAVVDKINAEREKSESP